MKTHPRIRLASALALIVIAVAAAITMGFEYASQQAESRHSQRVTACQVRFNNAYAATTRLRSKFGDQDHDATVRFQTATGNLIHTVFHLTPGPAATRKVRKLGIQFDQARREYIRAEARISAERAAHPFPRLPSAACQ